MLQRGITLIESLIGIGLLGMVVISTCAGLSLLFSTLKYSRENLRATQILIEKMEICRLYTWEQITDPTFFPKKFKDYLDPLGPTDGTDNNIEFSGTMSVKKGPDDTDYADDMKTIVIEIEWGGKGKHARRREFVTYVTRNGLQSYLF